MTDRALPRCRQTERIVGAVLDGADTTVDRLHAAACATCSSSVERARAFERSLVGVAIEAADTMPDAGSLPGAGRFGLRGAAVRLATLGAAVVAGLAVAAIIGLRAPQSVPVGAFASEASARVNLERLDLPCRDFSETVVCEMDTSDHAHRVELTEDDGGLVSVVATIENTDGATLDRAGGDWLFSQIAAAVLDTDAVVAVQEWLVDTYPGCRTTCATEIGGVDLAIASDRTSVILTLRDP